MALYGIVVVLHVFDILYYTEFSKSWGIGMENCKNFDKEIATDNGRYGQ